MTTLTEQVIEELTGSDAWNLGGAARLLLRVRQETTTPLTDTWFVILPEVPNLIPVGTSTATVSVTITPEAGVAVGAAVTFNAPGLAGVSMTLFVNLSEASPPTSFAYVGVPGSATGWPGSTTITIGTPITGLPSPDELDITISTTGDVTGIGVTGGIVNGDTTTASASVIASLADIGAALLKLTALGLPSDLNILDALAAGGTMSVQVPIEDADGAALTDSGVTACAGAIVSLSLPSSNGQTQPFSIPATSPVSATLTFDGPTTKYSWSGPFRLQATMLIAVKDSAVSNDTTEHATQIGIQADLPDHLTLVTTATPTTFTYTGAAVIDVLMLRVTSRARAVSSPTPVERTTSVRVEELPRSAVVDLGTFDPTLTTAIQASVAFTDENGTPAATGRVALSTIANLTGASLPLATPRALTVSATDGPVKAQAFGLIGATAYLTIGSPVTGDKEVQAKFSIELSAPLPADISIAHDATTVEVTTQEFPASFEFVGGALIVDETASNPLKVDGSATLRASAPTTLNLDYIRDAQPSPDFRRLQATVEDLPSDLKVLAASANSVAHVETEASTDFGAVTGTYSFNGGPSVATFALSSIPRAIDAAVNYQVSDEYRFAYGASSSIASAEATFASPGLTASAISTIIGIPLINHLAGFLLGIPATSPTPNAPGTPHLEGVVRTSAPNSTGGVLAALEIPAGIEPLELLTVELTDQTATTPPADTSEIVFSQCIRRSAGSQPWFGDQLAALDAPIGRRTYVAVPGLRSVRFDTLLGEPQSFFGRTSFKPLWIDARLDNEVQGVVDIALDSCGPGDPAVSSQWLHAGTGPLGHIVIDGSLEDDLTSLAIELVPQAVHVSGVLQSFDGSKHPVADGSADPVAYAAAHNRRVDVQAILADRVVVQLGEVENPTSAATDLTRPPDTNFPFWKGLRLESGANSLLTAPTVACPTSEMWARVAQNHDADDPGWSSWLSLPGTRAHVRVLDTRTMVIAAPPMSSGKVHQSGGPNGSMTYQLTTVEIFAHLERHETLEISTAAGVFQPDGTELPQPDIGTDYPTFYALALAATPDATVVVDDLPNHQGTSSNQFIADLTNLPDQMAAVITPASVYRQNNSQRQAVRLQLPRKARPVVDVSGTWGYGFPLLAPPLGAVLANDGSPRPDGVTAIDMSVSPVALDGYRERLWVPGGFPHPVAEVLTDTVALEADLALRASGWVILDRESGPLVFTLQTALDALTDGFAGQGVTLVQSTVPWPTYNPRQVDLPTPPGISAKTTGVALSVDLRQACVSQTTTLDHSDYPLPVYLADDTMSCQPGRQGQLVALRQAEVGRPIIANAINVEFQDWPDAPRQDAATTSLALTVINPPLDLTFASETDVFPAVGGGRPTKTSSFIASSGQLGEFGNGGTDDVAGPAYGPVSLTTASLDITACRWAPTFSTVDAQLTDVPGWVQIMSSPNVDPGTFPGSSDSTQLDMGSWNVPVAYPNDAPNPSNYEWVTAATTVSLSGLLAGDVTTRSASQQWNYGGSNPPASAPADITWNQNEIMGLSLLPTYPVPPDPRYTRPGLAMISGLNGPATDDGELKGLAFAVPVGNQLSAVIRASSKHGVTYDGTPRSGAEISGIDGHASTVTFSGFTGELSVQPRASTDYAWAEAFYGLALGVEEVVECLGGRWAGALAGAPVLATGILLTLDVNDPVVLDTAQAGWRIDPDPAKIPGELHGLFDHFGPNGFPGHFVMHEPGFLVALGTFCVGVMWGSILLEWLVGLFLEWIGSSIISVTLTATLLA